MRLRRKWIRSIGKVITKRINICFFFFFLKLYYLRILSQAIFVIIITIIKIIIAIANTHIWEFFRAKVGVWYWTLVVSKISTLYFFLNKLSKEVKKILIHLKNFRWNYCLQTSKTIISNVSMKCAPILPWKNVLQKLLWMDIDF